jgi:ribonucleoside-diphosphate reductase alpha chain
MRVWDAMCATLLSTGARRGAMMATLRCDHPDIEEFISAKRDAGVLTNFNLSVQVTDALMGAVKANRDWPLVFPSDASDDPRPLKHMRWPGYSDEVPCRVHRHVQARDLWQSLMDAAYATAEPGVLFVDRINRLNNLHYREHLTTTNPCGEVPLPPSGACVLGSINLAALVESPFSKRARLNTERLADIARRGIRFLDNVIELGRYPFATQALEARGTRRVGLGITGLADALIMLGQHYDSDRARETARAALTVMRDEAYTASIDLAREKGAFTYFRREPYLDGNYIRDLPARLRDGIAQHGIRNSHLLAIAPAGTISVLANNVSSGIEPVFALEAARQVRDAQGRPHTHTVIDAAFAGWRRARGRSAARPAHFITANELSAEAHLRMQAALQPLVDSSISKTINVSADISKQEFGRIYQRAFELGVKGCTVYRPNPVRGAVLEQHEASRKAQVHCCTLDREGD